MKRNSVSAEDSITAEQFAEAKHIMEIAALYGLSDDDAYFVHNISEKYDTSIDCAVSVCELINSDLQWGSDIDIESLVPQYVLCQKYNISEGESKAILYEFAKNQIDLENVPDEFFQAYLSDLNAHDPYLDIMTTYYMAIAMRDEGLSLEEAYDTLA